MLRELVLFIAQAIVDEPEMVEVHEEESERGINFRLQVAPRDVGRVIGRKGRVIYAFRSVVQAAALKEGKRATVTIPD